MCGCPSFPSHVKFLANEQTPPSSDESVKDAGRQLVPIDERLLPPVLLGQATPEVELQVKQFYLSIVELFELWVTRCTSPHTQRAYRQDVIAFIAFLGIKWPREGLMLLTVSVADVQGWRDWLADRSYAPKTINRRVSSLSSFYRYVQAAAAELRLPITVPNPAHAQFIARSSADPINETAALSPTRARHLMAMVDGEDIVAYRNRALIKLFLFSGVRIGTACRLRVSDLRIDGDEAVRRWSRCGCFWGRSSARIGPLQPEARAD